MGRTPLLMLILYQSGFPCNKVASMPRTSLTALTALAVLGMVSCIDPYFEPYAVIEYDTDRMPPAIAMQITAVNRMNAPVTLQLRHAYRGLKDGSQRTFSAWITAELEPGDSQIIGEETVQYQYKNQEETMQGFILLDRSDENFQEEYAGSSSFELEITMPQDDGAYPPVYRLAGYKTGDWEFFREGLADLEMVSSLFGGYAILHHQGGTLTIYSVPYLIEAELIIAADGTLAFNYKNVQGRGIGEDGFHLAAPD